jgi:hydrogenase maturation protease
VIGVGNDLRCDDASGLEVVRRLSVPSGVAVHEHRGEAVGLLELWQDADAVVLVDTVSSGERPGTIHRIDASAEPIPSPLRRASSHTIGLAVAIELARTLGRLPDRVVVYGIEGARFEAGAEMSEAVRASIPELARAVGDEARALAGGLSE